MQCGSISKKDFCRKWDEGLIDGKRTLYIIVCGLVYVGGKYWFVVLLHKCFQWKPCAKAAGNQSSASWHLQHMSVYVYLYMSIYRVLSLHFECVILICTRLCPCWLNLKPARQRVIRYAFVVLVQQTCCSWHVACVSCVCQAGPTGIGSWGLGIAGPDFFNCDHHTSLSWAVEFLPQAQYLPRRIWVRVWVSYGSFASREAIVYQDVMFCSSIIVCTWLSKSALEILEV